MRSTLLDATLINDLNFLFLLYTTNWYSLKVVSVALETDLSSKGCISGCMLLRYESTEGRSESVFCCSDVSWLYCE